MILKSRELEVIENNPFQNDVLGRKESGEALKEFVLSANDSVVVCIDAPWGQGKTTFLRMWEQDLKNNDITFYSEEGENDVKSMVFQVEKCDPKQNEPDYCKSDDEINDYIKDMQVQLLLVE